MNNKCKSIILVTFLLIVLSGCKNIEYKNKKNLNVNNSSWQTIYINKKDIEKSETNNG